MTYLLLSVAIVERYHHSLAKEERKRRIASWPGPFFQRARRNKYNGLGVFTCRYRNHIGKEHKTGIAGLDGTGLTDGWERKKITFFAFGRVENLDIAYDLFLVQFFARGIPTLLLA